MKKWIARGVLAVMVGSAICFIVPEIVREPIFGVYALVAAGISVLYIWAITNC
jgi:hypothetical protein